MTLAALTPDEREVVRRSMQASFRFFDADFGTRLGVDPETMRSLLEKWPAIDDSRHDSDACVAVNNALNELLHGVGISESQAFDFIGVQRAEMARIYRKWTAARGWAPAELR